MNAKLVAALTDHFDAIAPSSRKMKKAKGDDAEAPMGEFATVLEGAYLDFALFELDRFD